MSMLGKRKGLASSTSIAGRILKKQRSKRGTQLATVNSVKRIIAFKEEVKAHDVNKAATNIDYSASAGSWFAVSDIAQGGAFNQRVGDAANLKKIDLRFRLELGTSPNSVRCVLLQWHDRSTASGPVPSDILTNLGNAAAPIQDYVFANGYGKSFTVLRDQMYTLTTQDPYVVARWLVTSGFRKKITWAAASTTLKSNGIFFLAISDDGAVTYPTITAYTRVFFTDA